MNIPDGGFGAILADPPWSFKTWGGKTCTPHRSEADHYSTMKHEALEDIPVNDWAAKDCALFMWVVDSHLPDAIRLMEAWGFEYKTIAFTWVKTTKDGSRPSMGMGYWTRKAAEICLLGTRGKVKRISKGVRQVITEPRREHSRKPDETHSRVEQLVGGPYLEMFARQTREGWTAWGNETEKFS